MGKAPTSGVTQAHTLADGSIIILTGSVNISGLTAEAMKGHGKITSYMEKATMFGLMDANTKVNILTIKSKASVSTTGQMANVTKDNGTLGNSMAMEK
jgi:hypothetical protein